MGIRLDKPIIIGSDGVPKSSSSSKLSVSLSSVAARKNSTSSSSFFLKRPRFASSSLRLTSLSYHHRNRRSSSSSSPSTQSSTPSFRIINNGAYFLRQIADNYHVRRRKKKNVDYSIYLPLHICSIECVQGVSQTLSMFFFNFFLEIITVVVFNYFDRVDFFYVMTLFFLMFFSLTFIICINKHIGI